jgi:Zn-dependent protease
VGSAGTGRGLLNLLNLIPVWALDGGHAVLALDKQQRVLLLVACVVLLFLVGNGMFLLIALGAGWRLFTKDFPDQTSHSIALYFVAVLGVLAALLWILPGEGFTS